MIPSFHSGFANDINCMLEWRGALGYSKDSYVYEMKRFDEYCLNKFPSANVLTWEIALSYLSYIKKFREVRVDVIAIRNLGKFQTRKGLNACVFPADYFSCKKRKLPYIISDEELQRFFIATDSYPYDAHNPLLTYTVATIFRLQYSTGMRPQEVRLLTRNDINFKANTIYIADSKKHKDRCIAVKPSTMQLCRKYDAIAGNIYPETDLFFPNRNQKAHSASSLQKFFHSSWERAGNPSNLNYCTPYILRHNFATRKITEWAEEGKDFEQVMPYLSAYMGHQTFRETCYYLHLLPERISKLKCMNISNVIREAEYE